MLISGIDFKQFSWVFKPAKGDTQAVVMEYGIFLENIFDFIIVIFAVFCIIKLINRMHRKKAEKPAEPLKPTPEETQLTEIRRDLLKQENNAVALPGSNDDKRPNATA